MSGVPSGPQELAALWDARYRASARHWSGRASPVLEAEAAELDPALALDAGCGGGGDALWLGRRGWEVVGSDLSSVAVSRARAEVLRLGLSERVRVEQRDLAGDPPPSAAFELVSGQYLHVLPEQREPLYAALASAVKPGGMLLLVLHDASDLSLGVRRPPAATMLDAESLRSVAVGFRHAHVDRRARSVATPGGGSATVHDLVLRAVR